MTSSVDPRWVESADEPLDTAVEVGDSLVGDTLAGSIWTSVSRITGFVRAAAIAAVLGATYFGNTFQALNSLPNLVYYELLAGSLFASVLVPVLVRHLDRDDPDRARAILTGFLGAMLLVGLAASVALLIGGYFVLQVMAAGVSDPHIAAAQRHVGAIFLVLFVPQVCLYMIAGIGAAAQNARHKFALSSGAPALENVVILVFLALSVVWFGSQTDITKVGNGSVVVLGLGATLAVAFHAALQFWGGRRVGMSMIPRVGWHDDEVRVVVKRMIPALAFSGFAFVQVLVFLVAANRVAGGVVALQLALNFFYLPLAVVAWPIARALLPQLAHAKDDEGSGRFNEQFRRAVALASFLAIPIAAIYLSLSFPLARAVAFGKLHADGVHLLGWSIAAIGLGVVFETWFILGTYASYAREDMRTPLGPMALRVGVSLALMAAVLPVHGGAFVPLLAGSLAAGSLAGSIRLSILVKRILGPDPRASRRPSSRLARRLNRTRSRVGADGARVIPISTPDAKLRLGSSLFRSVVASIALAIPAWFVTTLVEHLGSGKVIEVLALLAGCVVGGLAFIAAHLLLRSPELGWILSSSGRKGVPADELAAP